VTIEKYKAKILPFVSNGREAWILTLREEYELRTFENSVLRTTYLRGWKSIETEENCASMSVMIYTLFRIVLQYSN
jgi:hypothetical protein